MTRDQWPTLRFAVVRPPEPDRPVVAAGDDRLPVGSEAQPPHRSLVTGQHERRRLRLLLIRLCAGCRCGTQRDRPDSRQCRLPTPRRSASRRGESVNTARSSTAAVCPFSTESLAAVGGIQPANGSVTAACDERRIAGHDGQRRHGPGRR